MPRWARARAGLQIHQARLAADEVTSRGGIPVTSPARTLLDLAAVLGPHQLEPAATEAEVQRLGSAVSLEALLERYPGRPGTPALRALLQRRAIGRNVTKQALELRFLGFLDAHGLPRPRVNAKVELTPRPRESTACGPTSASSRNSTGSPRTALAAPSNTTRRAIARSKWPVIAFSAVAVGVFGFIGCAAISAIWGDRLDRKLWLPLAAAVTFAGSIIIAAGGDNRTIAFIGAFVVFLGFNLWVPVTYARSAENFPSRARTTGFGIVDVGHLGGGIGVLVIAPLVPKMSTLGALSLISAFLVIAAVLGQCGVETRNQHFEDISP